MSAAVDTVPGKACVGRRPPAARWHTTVWRLLLALAWCWLPLWAQAQQYSLSYHDQTEGLGNLSVTALAQDPQGYLWVGTNNGVYRYDGAKFVRQGGLDVRSVEAMLLAPDGDGLWVGTDSGLFRVRGNQATQVYLNGQSIPVQARNSLLATGPRGLLVNSVHQLLELTADGPERWRVREHVDPPTLQAHPELATIHSAWTTRDGSLWLACRDRLCRIHGGRVDVLGLAPGNENGWSALYEDRAGGLWLRSSARMLYRPPGSSEFIDRSPPLFSHVGWLYATPIVEDREGRILTHTHNGLARWQDGRWTAVGPRQGLFAPGGISALLVDHQGALWVGTSGRGLVQWLGYRHLSTWTTQQGLGDDDVWSFLRDRSGRFHIGTSAGAWQPLPNWGALPTAPRGPATVAAAMAQDLQGNIWTSDSSGQVTRLAPGASKPELVAKLPMVFRLFVDSRGRVWICTQKGLFMIDPVRGDKTPQQVDAAVNPSPAHGPRVYSGCETASHTLWFATEAGLWLWRESGLQAVHVRAPAGWQAKPPAFNVIACGDTDAAWLGGTDIGGIWQLRQRDAQWEFAEVTPPHLKSHQVLGLLQDRRGWLWVSTDNGVHAWNRHTWLSLNRDNGLVWNDTNQNALYEDADGSLWVGTSRGAQHIEQPHTLFDPARRPPPIVTLTRGELVIAQARPIALDWAGPPLKLSFSSPWYENRHADRYLYRVRGLDDTWAQSAGPELTLSSVAPGDYRLEVMVANADLQLQSSVTSLAFSIHAPWWQTPSFYLACLLAVTSLFWGLHRWSLRHQAQRRRYLESLIALHQRDEALRAAFEHSPDGIIRYDRECRRTYANPAIRSTYPFPADQVLNSTPGEGSSLPPDQARALMAAIRQVVQSGQPMQMEVWYAHSPTERRWGDMRLVPEFAQDGSVASVLSVVRDITAIKATQENLRQSQVLLRQLAARNDTVREDERKHLAREIHDELGQHLLALRLGVSVLDLQFGPDNPVLRERTQRLVGIADSTIKVVRNVVTSLRPNALDMGIASALEWLGESLRGSGIAFHLQVHEHDVQLDEHRATAIFRIAQESLTNIVRHAQATEARVTLEHDGTDYVLNVSDNGCGFDPSAPKKNSFGLISIRERAIMLGGSLEIISAPQRHTCIRVRFPAQGGSLGTSEVDAAQAFAPRA